MKIVFFGASKFVIPILEVLHKNFDLVLVVTTEKLSTEPVISYCKENKIPFILVKQFNNETIGQLKKANAPLAILAFFGLILPNNILNIFPLGIINTHPSLLPKYRGSTPVQTAILNGDKTTGITILKLDEKVDHGPILAKVEEKILNTDTAETLYERLFKIGAKILPQTINQYIKSRLRLSPQTHSKATFTKALTRQDGYFEINKSLPAGRQAPSPEVLGRMIRAYYPWPGVWSTLRVKGKGLRVKFLPGRKLQVAGRKPMRIKDFVNGYSEAREWILELFPAVNI